MSRAPWTSSLLLSLFGTVLAQSSQEITSSSPSPYISILLPVLCGLLVIIMLVVFYFVFFDRPRRRRRRRKPTTSAQSSASIQSFSLAPNTSSLNMLPNNYVTAGNIDRPSFMFPQSLPPPAFYNQGMMLNEHSPASSSRGEKHSFELPRTSNAPSPMLQRAQTTNGAFFGQSKYHPGQPNINSSHSSSALPPSNFQSNEDARSNASSFMLSGSGRNNRASVEQIQQTLPPLFFNDLNASFAKKASQSKINSAEIGAPNLQHVETNYDAGGKKKREKNVIKNDDVGNTFYDAATVINTNIPLALPGSHELILGEDFRMNDKIGEGGVGSVFVGDVLRPNITSQVGISGTKVAVKVLKNIKDVGPDFMASFHQEIAIMSRFSSNRNIIKFVGFSLSPPAVLMKLYSKGSLLDLLKTKGPNALPKEQFQFPLLLHLAREIANGLIAMHTEDIVHYDIKPGNILIDEDATSKYKMTAVITDFTLAEVVSDKALGVKAFRSAHLRGASVPYAPPEILFPKEFPSNRKDPVLSKGSDVYSYAITAFELFTRESAWPRTAKSADIKEMVKKGERPVFKEKHLRDNRIQTVSLILSDAWAQSPKARPTMKQVERSLSGIK